MNIISILPTTEKEAARFKKNPKQWIEAKLEFLHPHSPLIQSVFNAIIQNNLSDREFYLFLSYYAVDRVIRLEQELEHIQNKRTKKERVKL